MEMETMDLKTLDNEQLEVYTYLVDTVGRYEDCAYDIVKEGKYTLYDDFESFIYETLEANGCKVPDFVEFDFVGMWVHTFVLYYGQYNFIDSPNFKRCPYSRFKGDPNRNRWEIDFLETIKKSRFLEIHD